MMFKIFKKRCRKGEHNYSIIDADHFGNQKLECTICKKMFGINREAESVLEWDHNSEQIFVVIEKRHSKKWPKNKIWFYKENNKEKNE